MPEIQALPHDIENEKASLGAMFLSKDVVDRATQKLTRKDFYKLGHGHIFQAIVDVFDGVSDIDVMLVVEKLNKRKQLGKIGGKSYIRELADSVPTAANADYYFNIVRDRSIRRRLIQISHKFSTHAKDESKLPEDLLDAAETEVLKIRNSVLDDNIHQSDHYLEQALQRIHTAVENPGHLQGVSYGFCDMDKLTAGMHDAEMIVIAARPSVGKTTLALNLIHNACVNERRPVGFCSMEMTGQQVMNNLLCISSNKIKHGAVTGQQLRTGKDINENVMEKGLGKIKDIPLYIDDTSGLKITDLRAKARRMKKQFGIELFILDYMQQLLPAQRCETRAVAVGEISSGIKNLAKELNIPIICIAQLNRSSSKEDRPPRMSDLRESGQIEQDADVIMLLHQLPEDDETGFGGEKARHVRIIIEKQRNGPQGICEMKYFSKYYTFESRKKYGTNNSV